MNKHILLFLLVFLPLNIRCITTQSIIQEFQSTYPRTDQQALTLIKNELSVYEDTATRRLKLSRKNRKLLHARLCTLQTEHKNQPSIPRAIKRFYYILDKVQRMAACEQCMICQDVPSSPLILHCNHVFCSQCIQQWHVKSVVFNGKSACPTCRIALSRANGRRLRYQAGYRALLRKYKQDLKQQNDDQIAADEAFAQELQHALYDEMADVSDGDYESASNETGALEDMSSDSEDSDAVAISDDDE